MPLDTPVTMDVDKVPLPDALETLATVTESRWRLLYFVAGDKAALQAAETAWSASGQTAGWLEDGFLPHGQYGLHPDDDDSPPPDPRRISGRSRRRAGAGAELS